VLAVGYLGEKIQERFGDGSELGIHIDYAFDGPKLLGTAARFVKRCLCCRKSFFVLYGDSICLAITVPYNMLSGMVASPA